MTAPTYPETPLPKPCQRDPDLWYVSGISDDKARDMCSGCPVLRKCAAYGIARERYGIWGGLSESARQRIRVETGMVLPPSPRPQHQPKDVRAARDLELLHDSDELLDQGLAHRVVAERLGCSDSSLRAARDRAHKHLVVAS